MGPRRSRKPCERAAARNARRGRGFSTVKSRLGADVEELIRTRLGRGSRKRAASRAPRTASIVPPRTAAEAIASAPMAPFLPRQDRAVAIAIALPRAAGVLAIAVMLRGRAFRRPFA